MGLFFMQWISSALSSQGAHVLDVLDGDFELTHDLWESGKELGTDLWAGQLRRQLEEFLGLLPEQLPSVLRWHLASSPDNY
jgi:hypothetical protein